MKLEELAPPLADAAAHTAEIRNDVLAKAIIGSPRRRRPLRWALVAAIPAAVIGAVLVWPVAHNDPLTGAEARVQLDRLAVTAAETDAAAAGARVVHQVAVDKQVTPASEPDNFTNRLESWSTPDWTYRKTTDVVSGDLVEILKTGTPFRDTDIPLDEQERRTYIAKFAPMGDAETLWHFFSERSFGGAFGPRTTIAAMDILGATDGVTVELKDGLMIVSLKDEANDGTLSMTFDKVDAQLLKMESEGGHGVRHSLDVNKREDVDIVPAEILQRCEGKEPADEPRPVTCASNNVESALDPKFLERFAPVRVGHTTHFDKWYAGVWEDLSIAEAINDAAAGDTTNTRSLGDGVWQLSVGDFRIYYTRERPLPSEPMDLMLMLGGDASSEQADIARAHQLAEEMRAAWQRPLTDEEQSLGPEDE